MRHLKRDVLAVLADGQPRSVGTIASAAGFFPTRAVYHYMRRLENQRLVKRTEGRHVAWQLTAKGAGRLRWFRAHPEYFPQRIAGRAGMR